jgi:hypothetical protein
MVLYRNLRYVPLIFSVEIDGRNCDRELMKTQHLKRLSFIARDIDKVARDAFKREIFGLR